MIIPNIDLIRTEALASLTKEFDIDKSLQRYASVNPELIKFSEARGLTDEKKDASRALFVSDYIFTESPVGSSEEERREDVIKMFLLGLERTTKSSEILVQAFHLAFKTASMIKRSDIFMAGRGIPRDASLLILKDIFLDGYLKICSEILGDGKCGFELGLLAGAIKKTLPSIEYENYKNAPKSSDHGALLPFTWKLLKDYNSKVNITVNDQVVIPNIEKTSSLVCINKDNFSSWNINTIPSSLKENRAILKELHDFVSQADSTRPMVYFRGKILKTNEKFFLIRNPNNVAKPFMLLRSTADEVNVSEILTLLNNRGHDLKDNMNLFEPEKITIQVKEPEVKKEPEKTIVKETKEQNISASPENLNSTTKKQPETKNESTKKPGFFARLLGRSKKQSQTVPETSSKSSIEQPKSVQIEKPKEIEKKKEKIVQKQDSPANLVDFISHSLALISVGDLQLFEIFDTFRESSYQFLGVLHSDFNKQISTFNVHKKFTDARAFIDTLNGLDVVLEKTIKHFYKTDVQIMPEEILFTSSGDARYVMVFEGNDDHLVGMAGTTNLSEDYSGKEPETFQRRTLSMRTNQILNSLKSNRFSDSIIRVLGEEVTKTTNEIPYDKAVLSIR